MHANDDDFSASAGTSYDRTFGADRHDLRPLPVDLDGARPGLMGRAAHAMRRILGRSVHQHGEGAALSRVAGGPWRDPGAAARS